MLRVDARNLHYRELNEILREAERLGATHVEVCNVRGQRYLGTGLSADNMRIMVDGIPGEDLAAFMDGPTIIVRNNAQDGVGNTMNGGKVVVLGRAGDVVGYGMRGGKVFIKRDVGYRVGIHMKGYMDKQPILVCGGTAGMFFGEYMAGGILVLLGLGREEGQPVVGDYCASGMHGGVMFIRGPVEEYKLGKEVRTFELDAEDRQRLAPILEEFCADTETENNVLDFERYVKIMPVSARPYGRLYVY